MFKADASSMVKLGRALRTTQPDVYRAVRRAVLEQAKHVAEDAKRNADWSTKIPGTIRASSAGLNTARVRVASSEGAAYEHAGAEGSFRHPVFADASKDRSEWTWTDEKARPFLHPALMDRMDEIVAALGDAVTVAVDDAIRRRG